LESLIGHDWVFRIRWLVEPLGLHIDDLFFILAFLFLVAIVSFFISWDMKRQANKIRGTARRLGFEFDDTARSSLLRNGTVKARGYFHGRRTEISYGYGKLSFKFSMWFQAPSSQRKSSKQLEKIIKSDPHLDDAWKKLYGTAWCAIIEDRPCSGKEGHKLVFTANRFVGDQKFALGVLDFMENLAVKLESGQPLSPGR